MNMYLKFLYIFIFYNSFGIGDVFSVQNVLDDDWLWVVSQSDNKSGLVPNALVEDMVRKLVIILVWWKN